jgi:branched-chain amino acid transport system substrate-binding protein
MQRVYASLPLTGPARAAARDVLRGAELALEPRGGAELVALDASGADREAAARENARRAAADAGALAYLGDFHSSQVLESEPVLADAGLLQVAPTATFIGLGGATLVRLIPHDGVLARGIARRLAGAGVARLLVVHDHDEGYGIPVGRMCADAAAERGIETRARPIWDHDEPMDLGEAEALLYVGVAGSGAVGLWRDLYERDPDLWLLGTDGVAAPWLARELSPTAAARTRFFSGQRAPWGFYGYEAMALILDSLGSDRAATVRAARSARDRDSVLGRYSIDADGLTTCETCGILAVVGGEIVWSDSSPLDA